VNTLHEIRITNAALCIRVAGQVNQR
jgi:hypothetical protein